MRNPPYKEINFDTLPKAWYKPKDFGWVILPENNFTTAGWFLAGEIRSRMQFRDPFILHR